MNRAMWIGGILVAAAIVVAALAIATVLWMAHRALPPLDGRATVTGLAADVTVDRDEWGRPWIRANSVDDLVAAQGYVMAQDRLWQMDLLRRAAGGDLAEIFGPEALEYDQRNRTLGMHQAADRAAADATPEIRRLLEDYARGVNDYIHQRNGRLPIEFRALGYQPREWEPADTFLISLYMYKTLTSTWQAKLNRAWVTSKVGPERARDLFVEDSPLDHYVIGAEPGGTHALFPARTPAWSATKRTSAVVPPISPASWDRAQDVLAQFEEESKEIIGSNNFVVNGDHTATHLPLLANDTHLALGVPALWYIVHLTAPGWNVAGFALPGAPLVIIGHNERIAWGFTNSNADVQDLYIEQFESPGSLAYRVNGEWMQAEVRHETIHVKGRADADLDVIVTRHGPVVYREAAGEGGRAYALRWTALEPGGLDFGFPMLGRAQDWNEFVDATRHIAGPGQNTVYADVDGNIGFTIPARIPMRASENGDLPVAGDTGEFDWKGYIPFEELPRVENPPSGVIATANARTVGPAYRYYLGDRQAGPYRTERIYQLLAAHPRLTAADCNAIQNDIVSLPNRFLAAQLLAAAKVTQPRDARSAKLIASLDGWDARASATSVQTSFVEYTRRALFRDLLAPYLGDEVTKYELWEPVSVYGDVWWRDKVFLQNVLDRRPAAWLPAGNANFDALLMAAADEAVAALAKQTGDRFPADWAWGRLHILEMRHPLDRQGWLDWLSIGPYRQGGTVDTVRAMGIGHGPAMRFVADLSNFDNSLMEIPAGESGEYESANYRDQFEEWFAGRGIDAPFSEAAEERERTHRLTLTPR
ncbi:MAG: penicillin acylase family protein [Candidatus Acidiferrales bacterium]